MTKSLAAALALTALALPAAVRAQDAAPAPASAAADPAARTGITPYFGVLGGYDSYSPRSEFGTEPNHGAMNGGVASGVIGIDKQFGPIVVGVEGNGGHGFAGDIGWEYGVKGRAGLRAGPTGLLFLSGGYEWVDGRHGFGDHSDFIYGGGVELGPKDLGLAGADTSSRGPRLRLQADTYDFHSFRPMAGVVFGF